MGLQSELFRGDPALEAAAVADHAHITLGAVGDHVRKIQQALNITDGAGLSEDGVYGNGTASAVLEYKRERGIINFAYQQAPDNIVGKMTIQALDQELVKAPGPLEDRTTEVGAATLATLITMDTTLVSRGIFISAPLRLRFELLRLTAAITARGNLTFRGRIRDEFRRGSVQLAGIEAPARGPIVFAAAPAVAVGGVAALEIAIAALALILLLCIVSEDFRKELSRLIQENLEAATEAVLESILDENEIRSAVRRCNGANQNPNPKCAERQKQFEQRDSEFKSARSEAANAVATATMLAPQIEGPRLRFILERVRKALVRLREALRALKDAANALFKDCGCAIPPF